jgi:hypothetical protein
MRRWTALLLLFAMLPWQATALAAAAWDPGVHGDSHALAHWAGEAHHHDGHDDGFHQDQSEESIGHIVHCDAHLCAVAVLPAVMTWVVPAMQVDAPADLRSRGHPSPVLEGPRRPPRSNC